MVSIIASVVVDEGGSVVAETYINEGTYEHHQALSTHGSPYLGEFETSEDWREALGEYVTETADTQFDITEPHKARLVYVSEACALYVFKIEAAQ